MQNKKKHIILVSLAVIVSLATYFKFSSYKPKFLTVVQEVKAAKSERLIDLPYPEDANQISLSQTSQAKQSTFETTMAPEDIQVFYKNHLLNQNWEIELEAVTINSLISKYRTRNQLTSITTSTGENPTIVNIDIIKR